VNVIGPKVFLTPGSISTAVDRLFTKGLASREENPADRRVRLVALTESGKALMSPIYRKHVEDVRQVLGGHPKPAIGGHLKTGQRDS
jgi:MarR family 2-MHQ and catechol resistance regulon transcriptional repressor